MPTDWIRLFHIAAVRAEEDGDTEEYRDCVMIRAGVPVFRCYCDNLDCRMQRMLQLEKEFACDAD